MGVAFFFGMTPQEVEEQSQRGESWYAAFPVSQAKMMRRASGKIVSEYVINPHWMKEVLYRLIYRAKASAWIVHREIESCIELADEEMRKRNTEYRSSSSALSVVREYLDIAELAFTDTATGDLLFPRGLPSGPPPGTGSWPKCILTWKQFNEVAIHKFIVRMHSRREILSEEGVERHWCDAAMIEFPRGNHVAVVAKADDGIVEIRFAPSSKTSDRLKAWSYLKDVFENEIIGHEAQVQGLELLESSAVVETQPGRFKAESQATAPDRFPISQTGSELNDQDKHRVVRLICFIESFGVELTTDERRMFVDLFQQTEQAFSKEEKRLWFRVYVFKEFVETIPQIKTELGQKVTWNWVNELLTGPPWKANERLSDEFEVQNASDLFGVATTGFSKGDTLRRTCDNVFTGPSSAIAEQLLSRFRDVYF